MYDRLIQLPDSKNRIAVKSLHTCSVVWFIDENDIEFGDAVIASHLDDAIGKLILKWNTKNETVPVIRSAPNAS